MDANKAEQTAAAVGATAEMTALFYLQLLEQKVPLDHALVLTNTFVKYMILQGKAQNEEE